MGNNEHFFDKQQEHSRIKTDIVTKYFIAWSNIMLNQQAGNIAYVDLFSGPGKYSGGEKSTPLRILESALLNNTCSKRLITIFNDINPEFINQLKNEISNISNINLLKYSPQFFATDVSSNGTKLLTKVGRIPTLLFLDPWGYKGLSQTLFNTALNKWGSDCLIFFNYDRINRDLTNPSVRQHINALFGNASTEALIKRVQGLPPKQRESEILNTLTSTLKKGRGKYVHHYQFEKLGSNRTSHHLIFLTKNKTGYSIMKDITGKLSSINIQGVPTHSFTPRKVKQSGLFTQPKSPDSLCISLLEDFEGRTLKMQDIFEEHNIDTPYMKSNYKEALKRLESNGKIIATPPAKDRPPDTFGDKVWVNFPTKEEL